MRLAAVGLCLLWLAGCESLGPAPIQDKAPPPRPQVAKPAPKPTPAPPRQDGTHVVEKGDTLFAIAFQNGLDYRDLAFWNNLVSPDVIKVGQVLRLTRPDDAAGRAKGVETIPLREPMLAAPRAIPDAPLLTAPRAQRLPYSEANWAMLNGVAKAPAPQPPADAPKPAPVAIPENLPLAPAASPDEEGDWRWPAVGALAGSFGEGGGKGIDIAGERLAPVVAAAPGKVVYSGAGLRGYGKMLIIKHADEYLSAYAHNQAILVREGEWVKGGQKIAQMGDTDSDRVKLHFEIRQFGKPVDPLKLLPERK